MSDATDRSLWELSLRDFLSATASAQPTPGGGSVSAVTASAGLGLVIMAFEISLNRKDVVQPDEIRSLLAEARGTLDGITQAADEDIQAFSGYMAALRLPKETEDQKQQRRAALQAATIAATESPLRAGRLMIAALRLATKAVRCTHSHVLSDVAAGACLLDGSLRAVLFNVDINLPSLRDSALQTRFEAERISLARESTRLAADVCNAVSAALRGNSTTP